MEKRSTPAQRGGGGSLYRGERGREKKKKGGKKYRLEVSGLPPRNQQSALGKGGGPACFVYITNLGDPIKENLER